MGPSQVQTDDGLKETSATPGDRHICGLKRKFFFLILGLVVAVVVVAAVLGGVLGSVLPKNHSAQSSTGQAPSSSPPVNAPARAMTGLALATSGSTVYAYYIDTKGQVVEKKYDNGSWASYLNDSAITTTVITNSAPSSNSPLAAISYTLPALNASMRSIFYFDSNGLLTTMNTTGNGTWLAPYNGIAPNLTSLPSAISIAACTTTRANSVDGIRVYFGAPLSSMSQGSDVHLNATASSNVTSGYVQEVGMSFVDPNQYPTWQILASFDGTDGRSGIGCVLSSGGNHLYTRNVASGAVQQFRKNDTTLDGWTLGTQPPYPLPGIPGYLAAAEVAVGGSLAVTTDGEANDYVWYVSSNTTAGGAIFNSSSVTAMGPNLVTSGIHLDYALAAGWFGGPSSLAVLLGQNVGQPVNLLFAAFANGVQNVTGTTST